MSRVSLVVLCLAVFLAAGCANDAYDRNNELWRQGYGFNNPNAARIQQGKKPLDF